MQQRPFSPQSVTSLPKAPPQPTPAPHAHDELVRVFNTALVSTQAGAKRNFSSEVNELTQSASFKAILNAIRQLSRVQGIPERQAAEQIIKTFRKMDEVWGDYVLQEGIDRLRTPRK